MASAVAVALPFIVSSSAHASAAKVDASQDTITCNTVNGTASVAPPLVNGGTATATLIKVKGILNGCTVSGPNPVTILSGSFSGKLTGTSNDCAGLLGTTPASGTIIVKWKADPTTPLLVTSSTVTPGSLTGGTFSSDPWGAAYGQFVLGGSGAAVTGSFAGTDGGASSTTTAVTSEDIGAILNMCGSATGLKTIHLGLGQLNLG